MNEQIVELPKCPGNIAEVGITSPLMLPPRRCAKALGLPEYSVRQWLKTGFIKGVPCGKKILINVEALRRMLEESLDGLHSEKGSK
jgi:hypothetical protein